MSSSTSCARIWALAKQCGAALLIKHLLLAAAQHIDGDPLDYLTTLASHSHSKEATDAARSPSRPSTNSQPADRPSGSRPYTAEEAKQLVWHVL